MKVKRFTKLALAGVGLAATAATLTTATYAWYVTNSKVEATGVQGSVNNEGAGQLYISLNNQATGQPNKYGTRVTFNSAAASEQLGKYTSDSLLPQTKATSTLNGKLNKANLLVDYTQEQIAAMTAVQKYDNQAAKYNGTLVSSTYYTNAAHTTPATGAYVAATAYYDSEGTQVNGAGTDAANQITPAQYNGTLTSTQYKVDNAGSAFATGVYNQYATYFDKDDVIATGDWVDDNGYKTTDTSIEFRFWLKSGTTTSVTPTFMVDNISNEHVTSQVLTAVSDAFSGDLEMGDSLLADAVKALRMELSIFTGTYDVISLGEGTDTSKIAIVNATRAKEEVFARTGDSADNYEYALVTADIESLAANTTYVVRHYASEVYDVSEIAKNSKGLAAYSTTTTTSYTEYGITDYTDMTSGNWDANKYYYANMDAVPTNTGAEGASTDSSTRTQSSWTSISLDANVDTLLSFKIWLEGSDKDCWDSCKGQDFKFNFEFNA